MLSQRCDKSKAIAQLDAGAATLALLLIPGLGNRAARECQRAALRHGLPLGELIERPFQTLAALLPAGELAALVAKEVPARKDRALRFAAKLGALGARMLVPDDEAYPECVHAALQGDGLPFLSVIGPLELLGGAAAAVVGAREASRRGKALAADCARAFAAAEIPVVSGGARGVDTAAHEAALEAGGATVVVLPQGLLTYVPPAPIARALAKGRAAIVSQFLPDMGWETHAAVTRNATISALARLVCVVEPKRIGGSIRTARHALAQGKHVLFFAPGRNGLARMLEQAGAVRLLGESARLDPDRLLAAWATPPRTVPRQADLLAASETFDFPASAFPEVGDGQRSEDFA